MEKLANLRSKTGAQVTEQPHRVFVKRAREEFQGFIQTPTDEALRSLGVALLDLQTSVLVGKSRPGGRISSSGPKLVGADEQEDEPGEGGEACHGSDGQSRGQARSEGIGSPSRQTRTDRTTPGIELGTILPHDKTAAYRLARAILGKPAKLSPSGSSNTTGRTKRRERPSRSPT